MVQVIIQVAANRLPSLSEKIPEITRRGLDLTGKGLLGDLMRNSPVDNGLLKQWWIPEQSDTEIHIKSPAYYTASVNDGTGVYKGRSIIRPSGKALKFKPGPKWNGPVNKDGYVYLKWSRGQKGQKFVEKSIAATQSRITNYFQIAVSEVL